MRKKRGLTKTALAQAVGVDLRSISAYEAGEFPPGNDTLQLLAKTLTVRENFFYLGDLAGPEAEQVSFRAVSKLSAVKRDMARGIAAIAFAFCKWLESHFELPMVSIPDLREEGPEQAAVSLRYMWGLAEKPVSNMVHLLESKGVRVFSLALDISDVDALCTWRDDIPYVFLNTKKSNARRRFDAAHELGHLVLHRHGEYDGRVTEQEADEFASAFLMPRAGFIASAPRLPDLKNILAHKSHWGVSLAAYIVRLHRVGLISDWHYRTLFQQISQRGYRKSEPSDHKQELSKLFQMLFLELKRDGISVHDIAESMGVYASDLNDLLFNLAIVGVEGSGHGGGSQDRNPDLRLVIDNTK
jgi:Zn-dependent peptidase ImmA (M78 family)/DNA-binding XRE family transcriptional regulator